MLQAVAQRPVMTRRSLTSTLLLAALLAGCTEQAAPPAPGADDQGHSAPTAATISVNRAAATDLALDDLRDFEDARRGLIASVPELVVEGPGGAPIWDMPGYAFVEGEAPDSVNPGLWRQAKLNNIHGLFKVSEGIYQLRGFDLSNMTLIEGEQGWIVVDPLTARETAARALAFAREQLGDRPVSAIIYTHSHVDHFGGVLGVASAEEIAARGIRVIAPEGFMEEATSENMLAGTTMGRRAAYMYGQHLAHAPRGHVDTGLGKGPAFGSAGIVAPTETVGRTGEELVIDGVRFVFQYTPASEAPAEFTFYLPELKAFCGAEIVSHTLHNLYTLRGAKVRDALKWSGYIDEAIRLFGGAEVYFGSHHWPLWGNARITDFLRKQRDTYRYIHDQTLRLASLGHTPQQIADELVLPESLAREFANRGYYGTVRHNAKAVYQFYFGWYDANPSHLNPLALADAAPRYVEFMGGGAAVLAKAQASFDKGDYRWVAEVLTHLVFAEPDNGAARELLARAYDQLGYQAESGPWRDAYLSGAWELRHGVPQGAGTVGGALDLLRNTPIERFLDTMAVLIDGAKAADRHTVINLVLSDAGESHVLELSNGVLHHWREPPRAGADATITVTRALFIDMLTGQAGLRETLESDALDVEGSRVQLLRFFALFEQPDTAFPIVAP